MRKLTKHDAVFLASLQHELVTQDTVGQANPRFWVVRDVKWEPCWEDEAERFALYEDGERIGELEHYHDDLPGDLTCVPERKVRFNAPDTFS